MIVKTIKDAELQIKMLQDKISRLEAAAKGSASLGTADKNTTVVQQITNTTVIEAPDNVLTVDGTRVVHSLIHQFDNYIDFKDTLYSYNLLVLINAALEYFQFYVNGSAQLVCEAGTSGTEQFNIIAASGATPGDFRFLLHLTPSLDNAINIGTTLKRVKKVWAYDLALTNDLPLTEGGTGASTASGARTNIDVYSKAEVDTMIAALTAAIAAKADSGTYAITGSAASTSITVPSTPNTQSHGHTLSGSVTI